MKLFSKIPIVPIEKTIFNDRDMLVEYLTEVSRLRPETIEDLLSVNYEFTIDIHNGIMWRQIPPFIEINKGAARDSTTNPVQPS